MSSLIDVSSSRLSAVASVSGSSADVCTESIGALDFLGVDMISVLPSPLTWQSAGNHIRSGDHAVPRGGHRR
ncbi:hypothetical protein FEP81_05661 [Burkholderia multivorans]|nr:hypothetical protein [Burkholderia multivorans]